MIRHDYNVAVLVALEDRADTRVWLRFARLHAMERHQFNALLCRPHRTPRGGYVWGFYDGPGPNGINVLRLPGKW